MSGVTGDNPYRASGVIAAAAAGGLSWQDIVTASTLTVEAGNAYWINTTSNACTITLPSSADNGDEIMLADYARNWGTNGIIIDSNGLNYQGAADTYVVEYGTDGQALHIVYSDATNGWIPVLDKTVANTPLAPSSNDNGIFGFGTAYVSTTNLVSSTGVVGTDVGGVGTGRTGVAACEYGNDKGIFAYGYTPGTSYLSMSNLVSNTGVVATDTSGVGTARGSGPAACDYGGDKGIFAYGFDASARTAVSNKVSNAGVVATDVTGVGTARSYLAATQYGGDKGIFGYGDTPAFVSMTNLVTNAGVIGTDVTGVGDTRNYLGACSYG